MKSFFYKMAQLSTWRAGVLDAGFPVIRWHQVPNSTNIVIFLGCFQSDICVIAQTADFGFVPNERMEAVFMSSPQARQHSCSTVKLLPLKYLMLIYVPC
jgi:hypothetical protein